MLGPLASADALFGEPSAVQTVIAGSAKHANLNEG
jgi:hypothetical protein